jgi:hypothetical protein
VRAPSAFGTGEASLYLAAIVLATARVVGAGAKHFWDRNPAVSSEWVPKQVNGILALKGGRLASWGSDGVVRLWDPRGRALRCLNLRQDRFRVSASSIMKFGLFYSVAHLGLIWEEISRNTHLASTRDLYSAHQISQYFLA